MLTNEKTDLMIYFQRYVRSYYISEDYYHDLEHVKAHPNSKLLIYYAKECNVPLPEDGHIPPEVNIFIEQRYDQVGRYLWNFLFYDIPPHISMKFFYEFEIPDMNPLYEIYEGNVLFTAIMVKILWRQQDSSRFEFIERYPTSMAQYQRCAESAYYLDFAKVFVEYAVHIHATYEVSDYKFGKSFKAAIDDWKVYVKDRISEAAYQHMYGCTDINILYKKSNFADRMKKFHWFLLKILSKGESQCDMSSKLRFAPK